MAVNSNVNISVNGLKFIAQWEGLYRKGTTTRYAPKNTNFSNEDPNKYYAYVDPVGLLTIGIGHLLTEIEIRTGFLTLGGRSVKWRDGLTLDQVWELKKQDVVRFVNSVRTNITVPLTQNMVDALVSFAYNVGAGRLIPSNSTLARLLNAGQYRRAADEFLKWNKAGKPPKPVEGLTNRRRAERELFLNGIERIEK